MCYAENFLTNYKNQQGTHMKAIVVSFLALVISCSAIHETHAGMNMGHLAQQREKSGEKRIGKKRARKTRRGKTTLAKMEKNKLAKKNNEKKTLSHMDLGELKLAKESALKKNDKELAIKYLEKMVPQCKDVNGLKDITLELADFYFETGNLAKAGRLYGDFTQLYPGNDKVEYASYKSILCSFYGTLSADRDQSKTRDTIDLSDNFLERADVFKKYDDEVKKIRKNCYVRLMESEVGIIDFYLKRGSYKAVQKRLDNLREEFLPELPNIEPQILTFEYELAQRLNNQQLALEKKALLNEKFPQHEIAAKMAKKKEETTTNFAQRF